MIDFDVKSVRSDDWQSLTFNDALVLNSRSKHLEINVTEKLSSMPEDFTFSFWTIMLEDGLDAIRN